MRLAAAACAILLLAPHAQGGEPSAERTEPGWVWTTTKTAILRSKPKDDAIVTGSIARGDRVSYRKTWNQSGAITWFYVVPPSGAAGWVPAGSVSRERLEPPPASTAAQRILATKADGTEGAAPHLPASRMDRRALAVVDASSAIPPDDAASDFATLQTLVDGMFGTTPETIKAGREADALIFGKIP